MIDVVVIISIHFVYNCTYVQSSGHLSCAVLTRPPPTPQHPKAARKLLSAAATIRTVFLLFFLYFSLPAESTVFCVPPPLLTHEHRRTDTDRQSIKKSKFSTQCALHSILIIYCVPVYCHLFYVYSLSLYLSVSRLQ